MGLDTSHGCWHGAYSAFSRWREQVAELAGIPLNLMEGFWDGPDPSAMKWIAPRDGGPSCDNAYGPMLFHYIERVDRWLPIRWDEIRHDVLHVVLNHSDCDGEIPAHYCAPLADRLADIVEKAPDDLDLGGHIGNFREKTQTFIEGLRLAASLGETVEFG